MDRARQRQTHRYTNKNGYQRGRGEGGGQARDKGLRDKTVVYKTDETDKQQGYTEWHWELPSFL